MSESVTVKRSVRTLMRWLTYNSGNWLPGYTFHTEHF